MTITMEKAVGLAVVAVAGALAVPRALAVRKLVALVEADRWEAAVAALVGEDTAASAVAGLALAGWVA